MADASFLLDFKSTACSSRFCWAVSVTDSKQHPSWEVGGGFQYVGHSRNQMSYIENLNRREILESGKKTC